MPPLTALHLAVFRAGKIPLPPDLVGVAAPGVLGLLAANPVNPVETRLLAAERAEALGLIETDALRKLYAELTFTPAEIQAALAQVTL